MKQIYDAKYNMGDSSKSKGKRSRRGMSNKSAEDMDVELAAMAFDRESREEEELDRIRKNVIKVRAMEEQRQQKLKMMM